MHCGSPEPASARYCSGCGTALAAPPPPMAPGTRFGCRRCGAGLVAEPGLRSQRCPWCDTPHVVALAPTGPGREVPGLVLPFAVEEAEARTAFAAWIGAGWFAPGDLARAHALDKVAGVYLPAWWIDARTRSRFTAEIGERHEVLAVESAPGPRGMASVRTSSRTEVEWTALTGEHLGEHPAVLVRDGGGLTDPELAGLEPFDLEAAAAFDPRYLAGFLCEEPTSGPAEARTRGERAVRDRERAAVAAFLPGDAHRGLTVETTVEQLGARLVLVPVWVLAYRYGETVHRFLVNGRTGAVTGARPVSWGRVLVAVLLLALLVGGLVWWSGRPGDGGMP